MRKTHRPQILQISERIGVESTGSDVLEEVWAHCILYTLATQDSIPQDKY